MGHFCLRLYFNFSFFTIWFVVVFFSHLDSQRFGVSHQSPLWYLISAGNLFQIRRLQFPFHCCHQTTTGIGENVAKNLNRILSISQIAFLARRNLNWKRTFIYISNKRNATPAQYINTTVVPTGLTSKNFFFQWEKFLSLLWLFPVPQLGRWSLVRRVIGVD